MNARLALAALGSPGVMLWPRRWRSVKAHAHRRRAARRFAHPGCPLLGTSAHEEEGVGLSRFLSKKSASHPHEKGALCRQRIRADR